MGPGLTASVRSTSMVVSRGQALRPKFSTRCYRCLQLSISDPFLPFWAPDWLCHVLIHSWSPIFPMRLWLIFQTVFYIPTAPQRNSVTTICELLPVKVFSYPTWNPTITQLTKLALKQQQHLQTEDRKLLPPPERGAWCLSQLLSFVQHPALKPTPVPQSKALQAREHPWDWRSSSLLKIDDNRKHTYVAKEK